MRKAQIIGTIALYVLWQVMDFVIHGILLGPTYAMTAELWRPQDEMQMGTIFLTAFVAAVFFNLIYSEGFAGGTMGRSLCFGLYFGLGVGFSMGFGTYAVQPIPLMLAVSWLVGTVAEAVAGAVLLHWVYGKLAG